MRTDTLPPPPPAEALAEVAPLARTPAVFVIRRHDAKVATLLVLTIGLSVVLWLYREPLFCRDIYQEWSSGRREVIGSSCDGPSGWEPAPRKEAPPPPEQPVEPLPLRPDEPVFTV